MPNVGGQEFSYSKKGRSAAQQRQRLLKQRFGKNWRQNFYGSVSGYKKGSVKRVSELREKLATGPGTDKQRMEYDRLYNVAQAVKAKRQRFDVREGIKRPDKAQVETQGPMGSHAPTSTGAKVRQRKRRKLRPVHK